LIEAIDERIGAILLPGDQCLFRVWAPSRESVDVHLYTPDDRLVPLVKKESGYFEAVADNIAAGARYKFRLDGGDERPDPASRFQPDGVHEASQVVDPAFVWPDDRWSGLALPQYVIYELHVGTFTPEGTFDSAIERLDYLYELGITAVELLPIAQFPGGRNWGYDGVYPYAAQASYGGPEALKRFVASCHARNMAVVLDVVYNHLGPEGNYLAQYGPYFTDRYKTPWGMAMNFDGPGSDDVRRFFIGNALMWIDEFRVDALRVDAVHAIVDHSAEPFLQDLCEAVHRRAAKLNRRVVMIAETDLNAPRVLLPKSVGGLGFDTQWNDDFHHSLHTLVTGENGGYYADFGRAGDLARVFTGGYLYTGQFSKFRGRKYGAKPDVREGEKFIVFTQNHDQIGNRMMGDRLASMLSFEKLKVCAGAMLLSPFLPMLFMGEEYGEIAPFLYFTSHSDAQTIENVRKGRHEEFQSFAWQGEPPDPHAEETFLQSKLNWERAGEGNHAVLRGLYQYLLRLRKSDELLSTLDLGRVEAAAFEKERVVVVRRWLDMPAAEQLCVIFNFSDEEQALDLPIPDADWTKLVDSEDMEWAGEGSPAPGTIPRGTSRIALRPNSFVAYRA
jgi:maltooligosyltrehalose trehalohydrolase